MTLTDELTQFALTKGADMVGIAPVERFNGSPEGHHPADFLPGATCVVVIGARIPLAAAENWHRVLTPYQVYGHGILSFRLALMEYELARFLEDRGYRALPTAPRDPHYDVETMMTACISLRHAAAAAGLGEFGWSSNIVTPRFGPRVRFTATITDAPLEGTPLPEKPICLQENCRLCEQACPAGLLGGEELQLNIGGKVHRMAKMTLQQKQLCRWHEHGLVKASGAATDISPPAEIHGTDYLKALELRDPVQKSRSGMFGGIYYCGKCVHVCPVGRKLQLNATR